MSENYFADQSGDMSQQRKTVRKPNFPGAGLVETENMKNSRNVRAPHIENLRQKKFPERTFVSFAESTQERRPEPSNVRGMRTAPAKQQYDYLKADDRMESRCTADQSNREENSVFSTVARAGGNLAKQRPEAYNPYRPKQVTEAEPQSQKRMGGQDLKNNKDRSEDALQKTKAKSNLRRNFVIGGVGALFIISFVALMLFNPFGALNKSQAEVDAATLAVYRQKLKGNVFFDGISVGGIDISGLTYEKALAKLQAAKAPDLEKIGFVFQVSGKQLKATAAELGVFYDYAAALKEAYAVGRLAPDQNADSDVLLHACYIKSLKQQKIDIPLPYSLDEQVLISQTAYKLRDYVSTFSKTKVTKFDTETHLFVVKKGKDGKVADIDKMVTDVKKALYGNQLQAQIKIEFTEQKQDMETAEINKDLVMVSEAATPVYGSWEDSRQLNLLVAAKKINGSVIMPGEVFSYERTISPVTEANGYVKGGALVRGRIVDEIGGGLCQPCTTLFQAALKADMEIVERDNHGQRFDYFEYGQDAMFYEEFYDLKFKNNGKYPVGIEAYAGDAELVFKFYGKALPNGIHIELESEKVRDLNPVKGVDMQQNTKLKQGETEVIAEPYLGSEWNLYRVYMKGDEEVKREMVAHTIYDSYPKIVDYGGTTRDPKAPTTQKAKVTEEKTEPETSETKAPEEKTKPKKTKPKKTTIKDTAAPTTQEQTIATEAKGTKAVTKAD